ncbi:MAG: tetratricopeptide repeat protein [Sterolibacteriaceae bacterium MAG5]|nr:tetratricopeptide repeat protein [Candidatus Nitricoxidireducens bremensis]
MTANAYDVSVADFEEKVIAASHRAPVLVDFWAAWCQPCRILKPVLEKLAAEYGGRFTLAKVNSDENQELAARWGVRGIPAVKAFVNGQMVDEFTGALPEAQVREFLTRLIPSPAEPLRMEAMAAHARGDQATALRLLGEALDLDPGNEAALLDSVEVQLAAGAVAEARQAIDLITDQARDRARVESLQARLQLSAAGGGADADTLRTRVAADPADLESRLALANTLALAQDYKGALENLMEIVRRDRKWQDEAGRKTMLTLFTLLGAQPEHEALVREYRIALARTLN